MKYRTEIWSENECIGTAMSRATHPKQVLNALHGRIDEGRIVLVYICNDEGQVWKYALRRNGRTQAKLLMKPRYYLPQDIVLSIMSGNRHIRGSI